MGNRGCYVINLVIHYVIITNRLVPQVPDISGAIQPLYIDTYTVGLYDTRHVWYRWASPYNLILDGSISHEITHKCFTNFYAISENQTSKDK